MSSDETARTCRGERPDTIEEVRNGSTKESTGSPERVRGPETTEAGCQEEAVHEEPQGQGQPTGLPGQEEG